ncbi:hypothetical protein GR212_26755 [Rhizobium lusitanum]|uniref:Short chain dehydrogenase n=1 Tax=Rhizobium lusitanum TaxID=293958 RepID=A0A6L9UAV7_9HYPH|nr:hypothetical protein [Rhizobium lusitanum]NEI73165.1 hypothetical protein [Rhizobium lusitanum]
MKPGGKSSPTRSILFSVIEPCATATDLFDQKAGQWEGLTSMFGEMEQMHPQDIAEAVAFIVTNQRRVAIIEIVVLPTD